MRFRVALFAVLAAGASTVAAQHPRAVTAADYAHAEKFLSFNTSPLVSGGFVSPVWMAGDRFWYRQTTPQGAEFLLVDPAHGTKEPAFNHARLAATLSKVTGQSYTANTLPFGSIELSDDLHTVSFDANRRHYSCDVGGSACTDEGAATGRGAGRGGRGFGRGGGRGAAATPGRPPENVSPDGQHAVFIRDWNLWVRDVATGQERQLTHDGVEGLRLRHRQRRLEAHRPGDRPLVARLQAVRHLPAGPAQDGRHVPGGHQRRPSDAQSWKYPLPGDNDITMIQRVIVDVIDGGVVRFQMPPDQHRSTICDDISCGGNTLSDVRMEPRRASRWCSCPPRATTSTRTSAWPMPPRATCATCTRRDARLLRVGHDMVNWHYLPESNEFIWYSERNDWGQLYLYDLATGKLKNAITTGNWKVRQVLAWIARTGASISPPAAARRAIRTSATSTAWSSTARTSGC